MKPRRLSRRVVYRNPWFDLYVDRVRLPQGRVVPTFHVLRFKRPSVAALVDDDRGRVLLIRSFRYATDSLEWEIPAGVVDRGERIPAAARREVREETGYETRGHRQIYSFRPINGISNKTFHVVRCRSAGPPGPFDGNEVKSVRWFSRKQIRSLLRRQRIRDGFSLAALLMWDR
jgi:8-oxo-dGTP pyrophosphatase MutT (NUDIX family)